MPTLDLNAPYGVIMGEAPVEDARYTQGGLYFDVNGNEVTSPRIKQGAPATVTELTAAQLAALTTGQTGVTYEVTDVAGRPQYRWDGAAFAAVVTAQTDPLTGGIEISAGGVMAPVAQRLQCSSGLPFVMPSNGTISNTSGGVTVGTAFDYIIGPSYTYFPSGALFASSPAGWYYTLWTAATIGTVYANTYTNGAPKIPSTPTPLVTVAGAYTQVTGLDVIGPNVVVPGGAMGDNGSIEWQRVVNNNNSAGSKGYPTFFGGTNVQGLNQTTNPKEAGAGSIKNRGRKTAQISANAAHGDSGNASTLNKSTVDTAQNQILAMGINLAVATDYAIIESFSFKVFYG